MANVSQTFLQQGLKLVAGSDDFIYLPGFIPQSKADSLLHDLWDDLDWKQEPIQLFGREVTQPRLTAWYGDPDAVYEYSGLKLTPMTWTAELLWVKDHLQETLGLAFNSVLANAYRNGQDSMGWHADNEPELGVNPVVASISLGAQRRFRIKKRDGNESHGIDLQSGSLLLMSGDSQRNWLHAVPKTKAVNGLRINLTFRQVISV